MKAAVLRGPNDLALTTIATPAAGPGELVLRVRAATVCGTDLRILTGRKTKGVRFPSVIGHEFAGDIVEVGAGVSAFAVGERVCVDPVVPCRACAYCKSGRENVCQHRQAIGYEFDGAFAEYVRIPAIALQAGNVFRVPAHMDFEAAALAEPLACCINGQRNADIRLGDTVLVLGAGPIGLMHAALARNSGARQVIVSEPSAARREAALSRGVDHACDPKATPLVPFVQGLTDSLGADVVIVAIGVPELTNEALAAARKGGHVNLFAGYTAGVSAAVDVNLIHYNELLVSGASALTRRDYEVALNLLAAGRIDARSLITHRFGVDDALQAFDEAGRGSALKVALVND